MVVVPWYHIVHFLLLIEIGRTFHFYHPASVIFMQRLTQKQESSSVTDLFLHKAKEKQRMRV